MHGFCTLGKAQPPDLSLLLLFAATIVVSGHGRNWMKQSLVSSGSHAPHWQCVCVGGNYRMLKIAKCCINVLHLPCTKQYSQQASIHTVLNSCTDQSMSISYFLSVSKHSFE